jgi:adenylate cyclase
MSALLPTAPAATPPRAPIVTRSVALTLLITLLVGAIWPWTNIAQPLDRRASDLGFALLSKVLPAPPAHDMAIVGLDEATLAAMPEPLALMHKQLGTLLEALAVSGARAVALDVVLPDRSYDAVVPGFDIALMRGILAMRRAGVLVVARTVDDAGAERPIARALMAAAGANGSGFALLPVDPDGAIRRIDERLGVDGATVPTLVGELARSQGLAVKAGLIDFSRPVGIEPVSMLTVLGWSPATAGDTGIASLRQAFGGKAVFVGALLPFVDRHRVPVSISAGLYPNASTPGVYLQAQALRTLTSGGALPELLVLSSLLSALLCGIGWLFATSVRSTLLVMGAGLCTIAVLMPGMLAAGYAVQAASPAIALLASATLRFGLKLRDDARTRHRMRRIFSGYVSPDVMDELEAGRLEGMTSQRRFVCVMFIDVRGFTTRAENDAPEKVTAILNELFEAATNVIHRHGGTVKEFMGDGVMAFFGAPRALDNPAQSGFNAARSMLAALSTINETLVSRGEAPLAIGIGLASGDAVVGHIGSTARHTYGAVGDCVNLASRLEGLTKTLGYPLLMSASVQALIDARTDTIALGTHAIKGHTPVMVFGWREDSSSGSG